MIFNSWKIRRPKTKNKTSLVKEKREKESTNIISEGPFETNSSPSLLGREIKILGKYLQQVLFSWTEFLKER
jgi:hypothetical protein